MSAWTEELAFALHLADVADPIALTGFESGARWRRKADGTIVTEADEAVERALRAEVRSAYPGDAVLGEEEGASGDAARRWIIDPIDGTNNYSWGIPVWATLVALEDSGEVVAGVVSAPGLGLRWDAARGMGARRNGQPIHVSDVADVSKARVGYGSVKVFQILGMERGLLDLISAAEASRGFSDFWCHMLVAQGSLEVAAEPVLHPWDIAPLLVIVEEAGGRYTDLSGGRGIAGGSGVSSNGRLHDEALRYLSG